jgi:hypothetical protein
MPDYIDGHLVYSVLGTSRVDESLKLLLERTDRLEWVPEATVQAIEHPEYFHCHDDRDNHDYLYSLQHLSELSGSHFKKKRNKLNSFEAAHSTKEIIVRHTEHLDPEQMKNLLQTDQEWAKSNSNEEGDILSERKALNRLLADCDAFPLVVTEVLVDGSVKAFSIHEIIDENFAICHFEKALKIQHAHLSIFLAREAAKELLRKGCQRVNWEQDLGLEGLRKSKLSYKPESMLKKYKIRLS